MELTDLLTAETWCEKSTAGLDWTAAINLPVAHAKIGFIKQVDKGWIATVKSLESSVAF